MLIAQLEARSGLSRDTIRYYERSGLITPPQRAANGYRIYSAATLLELGFIVKAREIGFSLEEIKPAIRHLQSPPEQCQELMASLTAKKAEIEARIAQDRLRLAHLKKIIARMQQR